MNAADNRRYHQCPQHGRWTYPSEQIARAAAIGINGQPDADVYQCETAVGWHIDRSATIPTQTAGIAA